MEEDELKLVFGEAGQFSVSGATYFHGLTCRYNHCVKPRESTITKIFFNFQNLRTHYNHISAQFAFPQH